MSPVNYDFVYKSSGARQTSFSFVPVSQLSRFMSLSRYNPNFIAFKKRERDDTIRALFHIYYWMFWIHLSLSLLSLPERPWSYRPIIWNVTRGAGHRPLYWRSWLATNEDFVLDNVGMSGSNLVCVEMQYMTLYQDQLHRCRITSLLIDWLQFCRQ